MKSELFIDAREKAIEIALVEDGRLMEVQKDILEESFSVGNIYLGRVKKVMPALNAAFVDVGAEKEAFLHFLDLGAGFNRLSEYVKGVRTDKRRPSMSKFQSLPEVGKEGKIADYLKVDDMLLVQVEKEPINTKGPRLTAEISLAGRNMVLIPYSDKVMVSNKIKQESERKRLRQLVQSIRPEGFGVIVRTVAEGKRAGELDGELKLLLKRWEETVKRLQQQRGPQICLISEELGRTVGMIRDIYNPTFESIQVNDETLYKDIRAYLEIIAPEAKKIVHLYKGETPIFDEFQLTRQMKTGLGRTVGFKNGGYLIIEKTEALFSIDVNSGSKRQGDDQEENAFNTNMLAAEEIAHSLRLRDIGGIIIVDFIDMDSPEHRQALYEKMCDLMKLDRAKHNVLPLSKFGLMQITRQRVRPAVEMNLMEVCPTCQGKGKIQSSLNLTEVIEEDIQRYAEKFGKGLKLHLHPFVCAYVEKGIFTSIARKWRKAYGVRVMASERLGMLDYQFFSESGTQLIIQDEPTEKPQEQPKPVKVEQPKVEQPKPQVKVEQPKTPAVAQTAEPVRVISTKQEKDAQKAPETPKTATPVEKTQQSKAPAKKKEEKPAEQPKQEKPKEDKPAEPKPKKSKKQKTAPTEQAQPVEVQAVETSVEKLSDLASSRETLEPTAAKKPAPKPKKKKAKTPAQPTETQPVETPAVKLSNVASSRETLEPTAAEKVTPEAKPKRKSAPRKKKPAAEPTQPNPESKENNTPPQA